MARTRTLLAMDKDGELIPNNGNIKTFLDEWGYGDDWPDDRVYRHFVDYIQMLEAIGDIMQRKDPRWC
jgi:hypothetical protein